MIKIKNFWWELKGICVLLIPLTILTTIGAITIVGILCAIFHIQREDVWNYEPNTIWQNLLVYLITIIIFLVVLAIFFLFLRITGIVFQRDFWNERDLNLPIGYTADKPNKIIRQLVPRYKKACVVCIRYTHKELEDAVWYMKEHRIKFRALPPGYTLPDNLGYLQPHIQLCTAKKLLKYMDTNHPIVLVYKVRYPRFSQLNHTVKYVMDPSRE